MAKAKASKPTKEKPARPKAAAWTASGDLVVLAARGKDTTCVMLRDGQTIGNAPAIPGAIRVVALPSGAIVTVARDGKTRIAGATETRDAKTGFGIEDVVVCHGVAYAAGASRAVARLDEAAGRWIDMGLRDAIAKQLRDADTDDVHSVVEGARGPIVGVQADSYHETLVVEWDGGAWRVRGKVKGGNALARDPASDIVYAVGDSLAAIDARGKARSIAELGDDAWGLGWLATPNGGTLVASTLGTVLRLSAEGVPSVVVPGDGGGEPHNHSLFVSGSRAAYVRGNNVFVIEGDSARIVFGEDPDDPVKLAARASALVEKPIAKLRNNTLAVTNKKLRVFPIEITRLAGLRTLVLSQNDIVALPDAIGDLGALEKLDLSYNHLTSLPDGIGRLARLRTLNLHLNCIDTLPASFAGLSSLVELDLGMNTSLQTNEVRGARPMTEVPAALRGLRQLRVLNLSMNELAAVPDWIAELTELEELDLSSNRFTKFPSVVCKLPKLRRLRIGYQPWTSGVTPLRSDDRRAPAGLDQVCKITTLEELAIDRLELPSLPPDLGRLTRLKKLDISFNKVKALPASMYALDQLEELQISYCPLAAPAKAALAKKLPRCSVI